MACTRRSTADPRGRLASYGLVLLAVTAWAGCSSDSSPVATDAAGEGAVDVSTPDGSVDGNVDGPVEDLAAPDLAVDQGSDVSADAPMDDVGPGDTAPGDTAPDVAPDIAPGDAAADVGLDAAGDVAPDVAGDAAPGDVGPGDVAPDIAVDVAPDVAVDVGPGDLPALPDMSGLPGTWTVIAAGTFEMGSPSTEDCRDSDETLHPVELTHDLAISVHETTQGDFSSLMGYDPSSYDTCGPNCPVENVSWHEAAAYCNELSNQSGLQVCYACTGTASSTACTSSYAADPYACPGFRLPTEAEWEYAARAGTSTALYNGALTECKKADPNADDIAWYKNNSGLVTHVVGLKSPNAWGIYDMSGNVAEWTGDYYQADLGAAAVVDPVGAATGSSRVTKGGSYFEFTQTLRSAGRQGELPTGSWDNIGFRCVRSL